MSVHPQFFIMRQLVEYVDSVTTMLSWRCMLAVWIALEVMFLAVIMVYLVPRMNRLESPAKYPIEGKRLMHKILDTVDWLSAQDDAEVSMESFFSGWFIGAKCSDIKRDNMVVFLAWTMYAKELEALSEDERESVLDITKVIEGRLGRTLEPGFNDKVASIRHTLDPVVPFSHRPLALYLFLGLCRAITRGILTLAGFRRGLSPCGTFFYWFRPAAAAASSSSAVRQGSGGDLDGGGRGPIVIFHGVGCGLPCYGLTLSKMCRGRTSLIVEAPSIAMSLALLRGHTPPSESQLVDSVEGIMERHGLGSAAFFGHSFGSISVAWMARRKPHLVSQIVLLDPVCILLFLPNVARSFLFPETDGISFGERFMLYLVTREKGISHTLRRHFWWYANVMWPEDIKCPIVVGVGGLDKIVPCKALRRYLVSHGGFGGREFTPSSGVAASAANEAVSSGTSKSANSGSGSGSSGGGFAMMRGSNRCKVHTCVGGYKGNGHGLSVSSTPHHVAGTPRGRGGSPAGTNVSSSVDSEEGALHRVGAGSGCDVLSGGGGDAAFAKRVELLYWPDAPHGAVLGDSSALDEFIGVASRQEKAFLGK